MSETVVTETNGFFRRVRKCTIDGVEAEGTSAGEATGTTLAEWTWKPPTGVATGRGADGAAHGGAVSALRHRCCAGRPMPAALSRGRLSPPSPLTTGRPPRPDVSNAEWFSVTRF